MAWERGYYYRVRRVNGHVVREYVGNGRVAQIIAELDDVEREQRRRAVLKECAEIAKLDALDADIAALVEITDLVADAALVAAGYYQHKRGEWRKRRVNDDKAV